MNQLEAPEALLAADDTEEIRFGNDQQLSLAMTVTDDDESLMASHDLDDGGVQGDHDMEDENGDIVRSDAFKRKRDDDDDAAAANKRVKTTHDAKKTHDAEESYRDVVLYGDYAGGVEGLGVDSPPPPPGTLVGVPLKVLAVSEGEASDDAPRVRVWAIGKGDSTKYWEAKGSEDHAKKALNGTWLPQIVANELHERMLEEGEDSVPVSKFVEEACNDTGDSVLVVGAPFFHSKQGSLRAALRAKRGVSQRTLRRYLLSTVRPRSTRRIAQIFTQDCTTLDEALNTPFEDLSAKLREDKVVSSARDMLHRIIQLANWGRHKRPLISGTVNVKIYLAAYMIAARPNHVFENVAELERKVLDASRPMLESFHRAAIALSQGKSWGHVRSKVAPNLASLLCTYLRTFKEWKLVDERKLAGRLTHALRGLEEAEAGLKDEEADHKIRAELQAQQKRLREKLAQIAGDRAVQRHDEERKAGGGAGAGGGSSSRSVQAATVSRDADAPPPPAAPAGHVGGMTNEQLAHELLLDRDFRLDEKAGMSDDKLVHTKIRETFERAFWKSLVEDLASEPPTYARVLSVLAEIRQGIEGLAQGHPEEKRIGEVVDMEEITTQLRQGKLNYAACKSLVDEIVKVILAMHDRMRSPERRKETSDRWAKIRQDMDAADSQDRLACASATCAALELVLERVHSIRVDTANNKLRAIAPVIREHGVEYEKSHFVKKLDSGAITLEGTKAWIAHTVAELVATRDQRVAVQDLQMGRPEDFEAVLYVAMVNLVADYPSWGGAARGGGGVEDGVPETMALDLLRIKALNMHFHTDVASSVILATAEHQCRTHIPDLARRAEVFKRVQEVVVANPPKPNSPRVTIRLVAAELGAAVGASALEACQTMLEKNVQRSSAVHAAMTKIFKRVWYHLAKDGEQHPSSSAGVPECARVLLPEVARHSASLAAVAKHNKKVHVTRYNPIIKAAGDELTRNVVKGAAPAPTAAGGATTTSGGRS